jgi:rubrerythrin
LGILNFLSPGLLARQNNFRKRRETALASLMGRNLPKSDPIFRGGGTMADKKMNPSAFSSANDILEFAIKREEEAARSYGEMAAQAKTPGLKELLGSLEKDEINHKRLLQAVEKGRIEFLKTKDAADLKISDYLAEENLQPEMNFQDLLIFAAKKEQKAAALYEDLAKKATRREQKELFEFLVKQEKSHKLKLESEYEKHVLQED